MSEQKSIDATPRRPRRRRRVPWFLIGAVVFGCFIFFLVANIITNATPKQNQEGREHEVSNFNITAEAIASTPPPPTFTPAVGVLVPTATTEPTPVVLSGTTWYLAEGFTGAGFLTFITILNSNDEAAAVDVTYVLESGEFVTRQHVIPALSRYTIATHDPEELGADKTFATLVVSDIPIAVERPIYFGGGGHVTIGATELDTKWYLAEGFTGNGVETFILIFNPNSEEATVEVTYLLENEGPIVRLHEVAANTRYTIAAHSPEEVGIDKAFAALISSDLPIMVERAMYFETGAHITIGIRFPDD